MINVTPPTSFVSLPQSLPPQPADQPFDLLLGTVSAAIPDVALASGTPLRADSATAEAIESGSTLLAFLGLNPIKAPPGDAIAKTLPPIAEAEDEGVATEIAVPLAPASVPQYQPIAVAIAASGAATAQPVLTAAPAAPSREGRSAGATSLRGGMSVAPAIDQIADAALVPVAPGPAASDIDPEPYATAAQVAAATQNALPASASSTKDPAPLPPATRNEVTRPDAAQLAIAASAASLVPTRTAQSAAANTSVPDERAADIELLGTSPAAALPAVPTISLANGPTSPMAISQADPLQTIADRQLDLARDTRWIDELARDIVTASGRSDRLSFNLVPPQLGQLRVDLSHSDQGLSVHMSSDSEATTQIVGAAQPRLVEDLKSQGIRVASTEVSTGGGQSQGQNQQQRDDSQLFEFARQRFESSDDTESDRPGGRFA